MTKQPSDSIGAETSRRLEAEGLSRLEAGRFVDVPDSLRNLPGSLGSQSDERRPNERVAEGGVDPEGQSGLKLYPKFDLSIRCHDDVYEQVAHTHGQAFRVAKGVIGRGRPFGT